MDKRLYPLIGLFVLLAGCPKRVVIPPPIHTPYSNPTDADADFFSKRIRDLYIPYGTIIDPVYKSSDPADPAYNEIERYDHYGDSAIWTGHYLAAEAFRYKVTRSTAALANVWVALKGIRSLLEVTGTNYLARCLLPKSSPYADGMIQGETKRNPQEVEFRGEPYVWIGDTSRDQYSGVMFGLAVAYDMVDEPNVRAFIKEDVTRILEYLLFTRWNLITPDLKVSSTFIGRPDQQLNFLQIARHINPDRFDTDYQNLRETLGSLVAAPNMIEVLNDHKAYFKFNLAAITLYNLIRLEEDSSTYKAGYENAYNIFRRATENHGNAHFNMIDRALKGPNPERDQQTQAYLGLWLLRPDRDVPVDLRGTFAECKENQACNPIPIEERVTSDFLWQRSPYQLQGGGSGKIPRNGIDFILPYWMGRYYGVF